MDALAGTEVEDAASYACLLTSRAFEVHFDAAVTRIVDGLVRECGEIERATEFPIYPSQQVEIEGGRDAGRIVIGTDQSARVFLEIDAYDQAPARR